jgi:hypothetical protein
VSDRRFAFMLGTGRCGSTIVGQVLALHPEVGFISNVDDRLPWLNLQGRVNNRLYRALPARFQRQGGRRGGRMATGRLALVAEWGLSPSEAYRLLDRHVSPMLVAPCRDLTALDAHPWLAGRPRGFFEQRASAQGRPLFLHKFTGWPRAGLLNAVFPAAPLVHVVRDGRAVAASLLQQPWWPGYAGPAGWTFGDLDPADTEAWQRSGRSFTVLAGLEWKVLMRSFAQARASVPAERWLELRYEDVVEDPRTQFGRLLAHLELEWLPAFERQFRRIEWTRGRRDAFRQELLPAELEHLESVMAEELQALGY